MLRSFLIYLSKAAWAQKLMTSWGIAWRVASRFVAGVTVEEAIRAIRELNENCINATLDQLGEHTSTAEEADRATEGILRVLDEIENAGVRANVSIKLTPDRHGT
jgi:proline dehydrogenase